MLGKLFLDTLTSSVNVIRAVAAIMLIQILMMKSPKRFSYYLWLIPFIKLLTPLSFQSRYSINNDPIKMNDSTFVDSAVQHFISENAQPTITNDTGSFALTDIIPIVWFSVITVFLIYCLIQDLRICFMIKHAKKDYGNVYVSAGIEQPFSYGFIHPKIMLPLHLQDYQKQIVVCHEQKHIERKDFLIKRICMLITIIHWFNPIVWFSYLNLIRYMELSCDEEVIKDKCFAVRDYCAILLDLSYKRNNNDFSVGFAGKTTRERIINIIRYKQTKPIVSILCSLILVLIAYPLISHQIDPICNVFLKNTDFGNITINTYADDFSFPLHSPEITGEYNIFANHNGIDLIGTDKTEAEVYPTKKGTVYKTGFDEKNGNYIILKHIDGYYSFYSHLGNVFVNNKQAINTDDVIATIGRSGNVEGYHLHFSICDNSGKTISDISSILKETQTISVHP